MKDSILTRFDLTSPIVIKSLSSRSIEQIHAWILGQPPLWRRRQLTWVRRSQYNRTCVLLTHTPRQIPTLTLTQPQSPHFRSSIQHINGIKLVNSGQQVTRLVHIMTLTTVTLITQVHLLLPRLARKLGVISARVNNSRHSGRRLLIINKLITINFK